MSSRANYVLVRDGKADVRYDRHGAIGCAYGFMTGPEGAADHALSCGEPGELLFGGEIEGGFLLDFDRLHALVFGEPDSSFATDPETQALVELVYEDPPAFLARIADRWPGWTLRWVEEAEEFEDYLKGRGLTGVRS